MAISKYSADTDTLTIRCLCGETFEQDCSGFSPDFLDEFQAYENPAFDCPHCERTHVYNMYIPIGEYEEFDLEVELMSFEEINARKYLREFIWAKRPDLQGVDREEYDARQLEELQNKLIEGGN